MFALAEHLGKTVEEIERMSLLEWYYWHAYLDIQNNKYKSDKYKSDKYKRSKNNFSRGR